ncbi:MAG: patatin-like phospholipase family protein [Candidatus Binatia bacterium]|jgi:hypothetical protein
MTPPDGRKQQRRYGSDKPTSFYEVILAEMRALRPDAPAFKDPSASTVQETEENRDKNLRELYTKIAGLEQLRRPGGGGEDAYAGTQGLSALCLSGGGIRSATFNLGVLQGLARHGLLGTFDYLSSVSGGGYIAGWLRAWMTRAGAQKVIADLAVGDPATAKSQKPDNPLAPEPKPIDHLREYSNYLTPRVGLFSADTWTGAAIILRNLLLNWLVLIPFFAAVLTIPQICLLITESPPWPGWVLDLLVAGALGAALLASRNVYRARRRWKTPGTSQFRFVIATVAPLWLSCLLLATAALRTPWNRPFTVMFDDTVGVWTFATLWCVVIPLAGWAITEPRWRKEHSYARPSVEGAAIVVSGAVATAILVIVFTHWHATLVAHSVLYVILAVPVLLGVYLLARALFVAIASCEREPADGVPGGDDADRAPICRVPARNDADREWWARLSGWVLLVGVIWLLLSGLCLLGDYLWQRFEDRYLTQILAGMGGLSGIVASLLGKGGGTASGRGSASKTTPWKEWVLGAAAPVFCVCVVILLAHGTTLVGRLVTGNGDLLAIPAGLGRKGEVQFAELVLFLWVPILAVAVSVIMGFFVNVNRFSLHGLYRNRLVRAYLGASNPTRQPDPFTGFDPNDNLRLHELWKSDGPKAATRPLPVINVCLNLVMSEEKLAWQQRKAESFSMTPFYCGNFHDGYRPSKEYGGPGGVSLGTAITISGAAANPNMGYHSSPAIMFLMGLFNARLGAWLGNVSKEGAKTYDLPGPWHALLPLFAELFGWTNSKSRYVNLSDGGHFDNLGLYEMVLRRCRYILVSDAGCDPTAGFEDLGNAIRKIRIDFGIPIEFRKKILISPREETADGLYCATATIHYKEVDGKVPPGELIYIKPALFGHGRRVPYDVYSYSRSAGEFPHESTVDQWFSEAQFESYRALGLHVIEQITQGGQTKSFAALLEQAEAYMSGADAARAQGETEHAGRIWASIVRLFSGHSA